jgi:DNA modification methylase
LDLPINQIVQGDCREVMRGFPPESIDMVMTSPPYWGLRDYGESTETVWDADPKCEHEWGSEIVERRRGAIHGPNAQVGNTLSGLSGVEVHQGQFCAKCGAFKGQLGLEPDWRMYVAHLVQIFLRQKDMKCPRCGNNVASHFAVFPEEICVRPIRASSPENGIVLDPMCGSGTTLVVAKKLGRRFIGIDLDPSYVEMAKARLASVPERLSRFLEASGEP